MSPRLGGPFFPFLRLGGERVKGGAHWCWGSGAPPPPRKPPFPPGKKSWRGLGASDLFLFFSAILECIRGPGGECGNILGRIFFIGGGTRPVLKGAPSSLIGFPP